MTTAHLIPFLPSLDLQTVSKIEFSYNSLEKFISKYTKFLVSLADEMTNQETILNRISEFERKHKMGPLKLLTKIIKIDKLNSEVQLKLFDCSNFKWLSKMTFFLEEEDIDLISQLKESQVFLLKNITGKFSSNVI